MRVLVLLLTVASAVGYSVSIGDFSVPAGSSLLVTPPVECPGSVVVELDDRIWLEDRVRALNMSGSYRGDWNLTCVMACQMDSDCPPGMWCRENHREIWTCGANTTSKSRAFLGGLIAGVMLLLEVAAIMYGSTDTSYGSTDTSHGSTDTSHGRTILSSPVRPMGKILRPSVVRQTVEVRTPAGVTVRKA